MNAQARSEEDVAPDEAFLDSLLREGQSASRPTRVVSILGTQRGGTTVVGRLLSAAPGTLFIGESLQLLRRGHGRPQCGCGLERVECPVWSEVFRDESEAELREVGRRWLDSGHTSSSSTAYVGSRIGAMLSRVAAAANGAIVIDTSKSAEYARAIARHSDVQVALLHVVRDPRGVFASVRRRQSDAGRHHPLLAARIGLHWTRRHAQSRAAVAKLTGRTVRYEDFVADPAGSLGATVLDDLATNGAWSVPPGHAPVGSGWFADHEEIRLRLDARHREELSAVERATLALTTPTRGRYGY